MANQTLQQRAEELWKDNLVMQQKWLAAVEKTRTTKNGWLLDKKIEKINVDSMSYIPS